MLSLFDYCQERHWAGHDPYDALNSKLQNLVQIFNNRIPRLILTQLLKRFPIDLRALLKIPSTQNPKALGLFLSSFVKMDKMGLLADSNVINRMIEKLDIQRSQDQSHFCWGYSFPWQTRTILVPRGYPNLVCTAFAANGLLDAYEHKNESRCLEMASSAAEYLYDELYWENATGACGFSYPLPSSRFGVHNANLIGAALLCRVGRLCDKPQYIDAGLNAARYSSAKQQPDGHWTYGESNTQQWIDNFHTGYNLCALRSIIADASTSEFEPTLQNGFRFYLSHFFRDDAAPRYFHNQTHPIDIHSVAQGIITLSKLQYLNSQSADLASSLLAWSLRNMWTPRGFFYYRVHRFWKDRTSYMRWSQAWMLLAISTFLEEYRRPIE